MKNSSETSRAKGAEPAPPGVAETPLTDDWRLARERLLLYLELMRVPRQQADELAAEALRRAGQKTAGQPVSGAMHALHQLLGAEKPRIASMPPLHRDAMVPVEIDRQPWWTFFKKRILRKK